MRNLKLALIAIIVFSAAFFTYYPSLFHDFIYLDDYSYAILDESTHTFSFANLYHLLTSTADAYWGPTTRFSYLIDYQFWQANPFGYHLTNHFLHAFNAVGIFLLIWFCLGVANTRYTDTFRLIAAGTTACLFAIHPQNVEAVSWIASRKDVLSLFLLLLTVSAYFAYLKTRCKAVFYSLSLLCFLAAIGAKPIVMVLPVLLLLFDGYIFKRFTKSQWKIVLIEKIPFAILALIPAVLAVFAHAEIHNVADLTQVTMTTRLLNAADMVLMYIAHSLIPLTLSPFYPFPDPTQLTWLPLIAVILMSILLFYYQRQYSVLLFAWGFFLISLFPTLGIVSFNQVNAGADRFTYLPAIALYVLLGLAVALFWRHKTKYLAAFALLLVFTGLVGLNQQQQRIWHNGLVFWQTVVAYYPDNSTAHQELAKTYYRENKLTQALTHYQRAASLNPQCFDCYNAIAVLYLKLGNKPAALQAFTQLVQGAQKCLSNIESVFFNMALIHYEQTDYHTADQLLTQALLCNPSYEPAQQLQQKVQQILATPKQ